MTILHITANDTIPYWLCGVRGIKMQYKNNMIEPTIVAIILTMLHCRIHSDSLHKPSSISKDNFHVYCLYKIPVAAYLNATVLLPSQTE